MNGTPNIMPNNINMEGKFINIYRICWRKLNVNFSK